MAHDGHAAMTLAAAYAEAAQDVLASLGVERLAGLGEDEVARRRTQYGFNILRIRAPVTALRILTNQFRSSVVVLLSAAAAVALISGHIEETVAIVVVLAVNTVIGFVTEIRAARSMEALRRLGAVTTRVRRDAVVRLIDARALVPGDIVLLEGGDIVTADLRLIETSNLSVDESTLTGESLAIDKAAAPVAAGAPLAERRSMAFKGTAVTRGSGLGVVVATGMATELGHISSLVQAAAPERSPLERQLERLSGQLIKVTLLVAAAIGAAGIVGGSDPYLMIEAAIALAVAAIPEGLPIVATMALARGVWRMARQNALVERLAAVETLGATTVIFTDKTGTLTENRMVLNRLWLPAGEVRVDPHGGDAFGGGNRTLAAIDPELALALRACVLCNNATLDRGGSGGTGDPLEIALLEAAHLAGLDADDLGRASPRVREEAFDADTKMMATFHRDAEGLRIFVKGAPEAVLDRVTGVVAADGARRLGRNEKRIWLTRTEDLAKLGLRVLALATRTAEGADEAPYDKLALIGLIGLYDPARADVPDALAACRAAGIRVVMITGDHAATARNIAREIGLVEHDAAVVEGRELGVLGEAAGEERRRILSTDVFARVNPAQKLDLVRLYQEAGEVVAMTGDGVNDAPALKQADIGVAMGKRGTQVAREAAAMVLQDDAFPTIVAAIREGRVIFRNIQRFVTYLLSCNLSEVLVVGIAVALGWALPLLPLQILFLNLVTDVFPAFALGVGEGDRRELERPPRDPAKPILTRQLWIAILGHGVSITAVTLAALVIARNGLGLDGDALNTVSFLTLAFAQLWHVFNMRSVHGHPVVNDVTRNPLVWGAILACGALLLAATYVAPMAQVLHLVPPDAATWGLVIAMSAVPVLVGEAGKALQVLVRRSGGL
jgi:Ca2+-transporting ATPase